MSDRWPGLFLVIEGPSGVGKSSVISELGPMLKASYGAPTTVIKQPSSSPIGLMARELADELRGLSLACMVAADRYRQLEAEIHPCLRRGEIVLCDRYVPSSLVPQVLDGVKEQFVRDLNAFADPPDLYVFLQGSAETVRSRSFARGTRDRFHDELSANAEADRYREVEAEVRKTGQRTLNVNVDRRAPSEIATEVLDHVQKAFPHQL